MIKPLIAGRDIRRWSVDYKEKYLIFTRRGTNIEKFPAIKKHLEQWREQLTPKASGATVGRKPGRYKWFEIQDEIAYFEKFASPKIVSTKAALTPSFAFDSDGLLLSNTTYFISTEVDSLYLLGILNSSSVWNYLKDVVVTLGDPDADGRVEPRQEDLMKLPIPNAAASDKSAIESLVESCLKKRGVGCADEETEINARVAKLYGL